MIARPVGGRRAAARPGAAPPRGRGVGDRALGGDESSPHAGTWRPAGDGGGAAVAAPLGRHARASGDPAEPAQRGGDGGLAATARGHTPRTAARARSPCETWVFLTSACGGP